MASLGTAWFINLGDLIVVLIECRYTYEISINAQRKRKNHLPVPIDINAQKLRAICTNIFCDRGYVMARRKRHKEQQVRLHVMLEKSLKEETEDLASQKDWSLSLAVRDALRDWRNKTSLELTKKQSEARDIS